MYLVIAIHHPRAEYVDDYLAFIAGLAEATRGTDGLIEFGSWYDEQNGRLVEMSVWESKEYFDENLLWLSGLHRQAGPEWTRCPGEVLRLGRPRRRRTRMTQHDVVAQRDIRQLLDE